MSAFTRFLHPVPATRRSYSSFFSKAGGGRTFKAPKPVVAVNSAQDPTSTQTDADASGVTSQHLPTALPKVEDAPASASPTAQRVIPRSTPAESVPSHPRMKRDDLQLHRFFSLHRPLFFVSDPALIMNSPPPSAPLVPQQGFRWNSLLPDEVTGFPFEIPNRPIDPDAEAARQLTRAITMSRVGPSISWDQTLDKLGVRPESSVNAPSGAWHRQWDDIMAESTKRKRRKKMKKHKLRKRRKLTRASRLKLK